MQLEQPITRAEITSIWPLMFSDQGGEHVRYSEFLRAFTYRKQLASFPNAKLVPPTRGDGDFLRTSINLNADTDLVRGSLRNLVCSHL